LKKFKINEISRNPAIFDLAKLNWLNGMHIRKKTDDELFGLLKPFLANSSFLEEKDLINQYTEKKVLKCINAFKDSLKTLKDFNGLVEEFFSDNVKEYTPEALDILKIQSSKIVIEKFKLKLINIECLKGNLTNSFEKNDIDELEAKNLINELVAELKDEKIAGKNLYMPIRAALTGKTHGPELPKIISILGIEGCKKRLEQTVKIVGY
jgi:nondiscriminating glutamyl-tRNA synthetase